MQDATIAWPTTAPRFGNVVLREFRDTDVDAVVELSRDPYVPMVTSLAANATEQQAADWMRRQLGRLEEGVGFSSPLSIASSSTSNRGTPGPCAQRKAPGTNEKG